MTNCDVPDHFPSRNAWSSLSWADAVVAKPTTVSSAHNAIKRGNFWRIILSAVEQLASQDRFQVLNMEYIRLYMTLKPYEGVMTPCWPYMSCAIRLQRVCA